MTNKHAEYATNNLLKYGRQIGCNHVTLCKRPPPFRPISPNSNLSGLGDTLLGHTLHITEDLLSSAFHHFCKLMFDTLCTFSRLEKRRTAIVSLDEITIYDVQKPSAVFSNKPH